MKKQIKGNKEISAEIIKAMKEGYPERKAISIAILRKEKPKKK